VADATFTFTANPRARKREGGARIFGTMTFTGDYRTGGVVLTPSNFGLDEVVHANVSSGVGAGAFYLAFYDADTNKIAFTAVAVSELADETDITGMIVTVEVFGY